MSMYSGIIAEIRKVKETIANIRNGEAIEAGISSDVTEEMGKFGVDGNQ